MVEVVAFSMPNEDITSVWSALTQEHSIAIAQSYTDDAVAGLGVLDRKSVV